MMFGDILLTRREVENFHTCLQRIQGHVRVEDVCINLPQRVNNEQISKPMLILGHGELLNTRISNLDKHKDFVCHNLGTLLQKGVLYSKQFFQHRFPMYCYWFVFFMPYIKIRIKTIDDLLALQVSRNGAST